MLGRPEKVVFKFVSRKETNVCDEKLGSDAVKTISFGDSPHHLSHEKVRLPWKVNLI